MRRTMNVSKYRATRIQSEELLKFSKNGLGKIGFLLKKPRKFK